MSDTAGKSSAFELRMRIDGGPNWRGRRGHFARRIGILIILSIFSIFILGAVSASFLFDREIDPHGDGGPPPQALLVLIPIGIVFYTIVRGLKRTAAPIEAVMDAADRVADGDYSVRVDPQGSPEVWHLMNSFNAMTSRLQTNEDQRRMLLADIAHELRNPLAIIRGNVEGMIDGVYGRDDDHLTLLLEETAHMTRLLEDLQTLSMAEAGVLRLHPESVELRLFLLDVVNALQPQAAAAGIELRLDPPAEGEATVDPVRMRQVIENLITNSLRYTPDGGMVQVSGQSNNIATDIVVFDNGEGIALSVLPHIFDRFTKAADSGGTGLGLAIARRLVEAHGGSITAESTVGLGTTIRIRLPTIRGA